MMLEILVGIGLFSGIVLLLTLLVLWVRARLVPAGHVSIRINEGFDLEVQAGNKLLETLTANGIFLPSACGGSGTCGLCRVVIPQGAGALMPTEAALIPRREAAAGQRLACQVTVARDMQIRLPESVFGARHWNCTVRSNRNVSTCIKEVVLEMPAGEAIDFKAGAYVQVTCPPHELRFSAFDIDEEYRADWERLGLFDLESIVTEPAVRAYSLANYPAENKVIMLNVRIATPPPNASGKVPPGMVSSYIFNLKPGDQVNVSGAYGDFFARETGAEMVFVGGGAGMAPMRSHIFDQLKRIHSGRQISFWYGARNLREAFYVDEFSALAKQHANFSWHLALSEPLPADDWTGPVGFIHDVLYEQYLRHHSDPEECEYYVCGPPMMIAAVRKMLYDMAVEEENIIYDDFGN
jgi:Na+-transporting NADH:ubiquinone oxidoreductase subunit F